MSASALPFWQIASSRAAEKQVMRITNAAAAKAAALTVLFHPPDR